MLMLSVVSADLSDDEQELVNHLQWRLSESWPFLGRLEEYYDGEQRMQNLGIAVPPELHALRTAAGWPGVVVDTIDERLDVQGFRLGSSPDADDDMWNIWTHNRMDHDSGLAHLDALMYGRSFVMAGTSDDSSGMPLITVESPLNMAAIFDPATHRVTSALQLYQFFGDAAAALYLPDQTVHLVNPGGKGWQVRERDEHNLGRCPVVMLTNRSRANDRYGRSEITPEVMSWTDAACRTLLGMEIAREFFAAPQRYIIGASESAFMDADGNPKSAWETYIGRVLALEADEEGNLPQVGQFSMGSPQAFTDQLKSLSQLVSARTGVPQHLLGWSTDNPASADGILAAESALNRRARRRQRSFGPQWSEVQQLALTIANNGHLPPDAHQIEALWMPPETPTPTETSAAILSQVQSGAVPPVSDVILSRLGYTPMEIQRLDADRKRAVASTDLAAVASALSAAGLRQQLTMDATEAEHGGSVPAPPPPARAQPAVQPAQPANGRG
jgi:hypothetical protein